MKDTTMLRKKTPILIGAGLLVAGASVFGAVSANAADDTAPTTSSVDGSDTSGATGLAGQGDDTSRVVTPTEDGGVAVSVAPGTSDADGVASEAAH